MDLGLQGKKAVVTGASAGIGKAVTRTLAREGVDVAICARRKEPLEEAAAEISKETGRKIVPIAADLTKSKDAENFIKHMPLWGASTSSSTMPEPPQAASSST
jgi:3-oxoacyl-[acyl-carrier protein] reductase